MILNKICFIKQIVFKKTQYIQIIHSTLSCDQGLEKQFQDNGQPQFKNSPIFQHFSQKTTKKKKQHGHYMLHSTVIIQVLGLHPSYSGQKRLLKM